MDALKAFQEFPRDYDFAGNRTDILRQVENAVPLSFWRFGREIERALRHADNVGRIPPSGSMAAEFTPLRLWSELFEGDGDVHDLPPPRRHSPERKIRRVRRHRYVLSDDSGDEYTLGNGY